MDSSTPFRDPVETRRDDGSRQSQKREVDGFIAYKGCDATAPEGGRAYCRRGASRTVRDGARSLFG